MKKLFFSIFLLLFCSMPVIANEYPTIEETVANEYPTQETVRFVMNCMSKLGGQTDGNLYTCAYKYDSIKVNMTYSDYEEGYTFERNKKMPGEKGSSFRDNKRGERLYEELLQVRVKADSNCLEVKNVKMIKPTSQ